MVKLFNLWRCDNHPISSSGSSSSSSSSFTIKSSFLVNELFIHEILLFQLFEIPWDEDVNADEDEANYHLLTLTHPIKNTISIELH